MAKQIYIDENGNEQLVSGTINNASLLPISANDTTNTKDYIDNINTTLSGRNNIKYYDLPVTTENNSYVTPFSAYVSENLPSNLRTKTILSAQAVNDNSTNPTSVQFKNYTVYVYSRGPLTTTIRVVYID